MKRKEKFKNFVCDNAKELTTSIAVMALSAPVHVFAESTIATSISTSMETIVTDTIATISAIAPIGITIFGAMFCWKKGIQFFQRVTS